ncbi:MAG TPA: pilus assembly protein PilP [candidate division Zixibacteria bacterium]|nr:pilus assembly protein PilP [candidate division Zixibacteria bacterium]
MKLRIVLLAALALAARPGGTSGQEKIETPSQKTREAIEKFSKTPATIGKSLETLTEAARAKLKEMLGDQRAEKAKPQPSDFTLPPKKAVESPAPQPSLAGKRDPFRPFNMTVKAAGRGPREALSPLERFELGQLRVVGIVWDLKEPRAMIEDSGGLGYVVKVGTPIGNNDGKVKEIRRTEIVVEENYTDLYGNLRKREVPMKLAVE